MPDQPPPVRSPGPGAPQRPTNPRARTADNAADSTAADTADSPVDDAAAPPPSGRAYGGQSLAERQAARRARLIDTGIEVFGRLGLRGATVRGVCTAAGLTDRYFYESFDSLEALLQAVYCTLADRLKARLLALEDRPWSSVEARASAGYDAWFDVLRDPLVARIVLAEVLGVSPGMDALYSRRMAEFAELTTAPMATALPPGRLAGARRTLVGHALVGASLQVAKMWVAGGYREPQAEVVHCCVQVALGTLQALDNEPDTA